MAILIDPPLWPAHGTLWSHLVSDRSYQELHEFAARIPIPRRGFDLDHYDVPESLYEHVIALGAEPVGSRDVVHRLRSSNLRVKQADRVAVTPIRRRQYLVSEWAKLAPNAGIDPTGEQLEAWLRLGNDVIERWNEPHRAYHDERHLEDVLLSLNQLETRGERVDVMTFLAAWFHDAVYDGVGGEDEEASARVAVTSLGELSLANQLIQRVGEIIVATTPTFVHAHIDTPLAHLLDADLAIFASGPGRYLEYTDAVRREYAHVADPDFRTGRSAILANYLQQPTIYRTNTARGLWEHRARANLEREISRLTTDWPLD